MNSIELEELREKLLPYLPVALEETGVDMVFFMLTNIVKENTELLCCGPNASTLVHEAFRLPEADEIYFLKGLVSRKKQLIPSLVSALQQ